MCHASEGYVSIFSGKAANTKRLRTVERVNTQTFPFRLQEKSYELHLTKLKSIFTSNDMIG